MDDIMNIYKEVKSTVEETLCPIVTCLFENCTIQMRSEEQDEIDRLGIALYGQKEQQTDLFRQSKIERKQNSPCSKNTSHMQSINSPRNKKVLKNGIKIPTLQLGSDFLGKELERNQATERMSFLRSNDEIFSTEGIDNDMLRSWMVEANATLKSTEMDSNQPSL